MCSSELRDLTASQRFGPGWYWRDLVAARTVLAPIPVDRGLPAMTPDGRRVGFVGGLGSGTCSIWDSQKGALVFTSTILTLATAVGISRDGNRLAMATTTGLFTGDAKTGKTVRASSKGCPSHPGLRFSQDGRFLAYA